MEEILKEVFYDKYCKTCEHFSLSEDKDPCHDCLNEPVNTYSHKPVYWEEKK